MCARLVAAVPFHHREVVQGVVLRRLQGMLSVLTSSCVVVLPCFSGSPSRCCGAGACVLALRLLFRSLAELWVLFVGVALRGVRLPLRSWLPSRPAVRYQDVKVAAPPGAKPRARCHL
eukprot:6739740-Alexandrium_andersonii.AAC.1